MQEVKSSTISHIGHDPAANRLTIKFQNGGTYTYDGVSEDEHKAFMAAPSVGKHFAANIRAKYKSVRTKGTL